MKLSNIEELHLSKNLIINSILVWYFDKTQNQEKNRPSKIFHLIYYPLFLTVFFYFLLETIIRLIFRKINKSTFEKKIAYVYFANSHKKVISKIKEHNEKYYPDFIHEYVSSRKIIEIFNRSTNYLDVSSFQNFKTSILFFNSFIKFYFTKRKELFNTLNNIGKFKLISFFSLSFKLVQSIRFQQWTKQYYSKNNIQFIYSGNDTCYRSYWLSKLKKIKTCTIQHGIPENAIQYYSISNYFVCWDEVSLNSIPLNKSVQYIIAGYPKNKLNLNLNCIEKDTVLIILTKLEKKQVESLRNLLKMLNSYSFKIKLKFHPIEEKNIILKFEKKYKFKTEVNDISTFENIFVIDSTFGIDMIFSGIKIVPLSFNRSNTFNKYFDYISVESFSKLIPNKTKKELKLEINEIKNRQFIISEIDLKKIEFSTLNK